jgi:hypothetical protein
VSHKFLFKSAGNTLNTAKTVMNTIAFTTLSKSQVVKHIWANRADNGFNGKNADLKLMSDEDLQKFYDAMPMVDAPAVVSTDTVEETTNVIARLTSKGEQYYTIGLELVETNGLSFRFKHNDKIVLVANDVDLYKIHKESPIAIGTVMHFNYEGPETFKTLTGDLLVANNNADNRFRGTISKSCNDIFAVRLIQKEEKRMQKTIAVMEIAEKYDVSTRKVRQLASQSQSADILADLKAKLHA